MFRQMRTIWFAHGVALFALASAGLFVFVLSATDDTIPVQAETPATVTTLLDEPPPEVAGVTTAPFAWPMDRAEERITKKPFALYIEEGKSPVPNDRFNGYHVGVDFETFPEEQETDVPVFAICDGPLTLKQDVNGYGGVAIQSCVLDNEPIQVLYGHLNLLSIEAEVGDPLSTGDQIGRLGKGGTEETDGVRKHLHLSLHPGTELEFRGYVDEEAEVNAWLDPVDYLE